MLASHIPEEVSLLVDTGFQGIQKIEIDDAVYDTISIRMKNSNLTKCTITKDHIYLFLSEGGYSKHYEDIILIYCTITNKKPPNISKYEEELATMFRVQPLIRYAHPV